MIRFKTARSRHYVSLPESEVVKIATMGLGFYMRRKLLNVHIPDLAHLAEKVCQTELMKKEKEKYRSEQRSKSKHFIRKEKVAYVTMKSLEEELNFETEQKIEDWDISLCPRCNAVFDAEVAAIFEKERMKKELAHREEQVSNGFRTVKSSRSGMPFIDTIHNGDIEDLLETNIPIFVVELETCPKRIPFPTKMEKGKGIAQSSGVDKGKEVDVDKEYFEERDDDMIETISIILTEYLGEYEGDPE
ncbi:hypothetical protein Ahy_B05g074810 [Arachis hypogaea]|uniref:Uncharacterized protein n=1 Tax=Arachis hypogaea TaxID=3818 RepID=A0A444YZV8_ARAHY|nr:hypothetical protein Ahy_B05g074810 [Arachis hypogaea]